ncbi:unnamed protein product [Lactuca virosa]|uniref:Uncharacterized protein n=1 Tax=Lactuca virosa TaxID=75947 RepID=A0AAU9MK08_9ASTR|nr:unnamed protein product [Lactuca virosa]
MAEKKVQHSWVDAPGLILMWGGGDRFDPCSPQKVSHVGKFSMETSMGSVFALPLGVDDGFKNGMRRYQYLALAGRYNQQNQNHPQQYYPMQQSYNTFKLKENQSYNPWNQFSQRVPETQFQSSQAANFQFHDAQNIESDSSSDDPSPQRNREETSEDLQPVAEKKRNYTHRQKRKK